VHINLGEHPRSSVRLSSHPLGIWTSTSDVFSSEEITKRFSLHSPVSVVVVTVSITVPVCGHGREAHTCRDSFETRSSRSVRRLCVGELGSGNGVGSTYCCCGCWCIDSAGRLEPIPDLFCLFPATRSFH
jgi:hypothetical protein